MAAEQLTHKTTCHYTAEAHCSFEDETPTSCEFDIDVDTAVRIVTLCNAVKAADAYKIETYDGRATWLDEHGKEYQGECVRLEVTSKGFAFIGYLRNTDAVLKCASQSIVQLAKDFGMAPPSHLKGQEADQGAPPAYMDAPERNVAWHICHTGTAYYSTSIKAGETDVLCIHSWDKAGAARAAAIVELHNAMIESGEHVDAEKLVMSLYALPVGPWRVVESKGSSPARIVSRSSVNDAVFIMDLRSHSESTAAYICELHSMAVELARKHFA